MTEPTPPTIRRTTFTLTITSVAVRVVCGARLPRWLGKDGITLRYPRWVAGQGPTMTNVIRIASAPKDVEPELLAHEFCHLLQWHEGYWRFLLQYAWGLIRGGDDLDHPLEKNAWDYALAMYADFVPFVRVMQDAAK